MWILDLVDTNVRLINDGEILYAEPGIALVEPKQLSFGGDALAKIKLQPDQEQSQYWQKLDQSPVHPSGFAAETQADLIFRQISEMCEQSDLQSDDPVWVTVPGNLSNAQIALLYGIAVQAELRIADFVDRGVAAAATSEVNGTCVFLDIGLHRTVVTQLSVEDVVSKVRVSVVSRLGLLPLLNAWIRHATDRFLDSARFDPRKFASTEQQVFDQLWHFVASDEETNIVHVEHLGNVRQVELSRTELAAAAHEHYRGVLTYIDQGCPVLLSSDSSILPGLVEFLNSAGSSCVDRDLSDLADAIGRLEASDVQADSRSLHVEVPHVERERSSVSEEAVSLPAPTHVLRQSIAYPIGKSFTSGDLGGATLDFQINTNAGGWEVVPVDGAIVEVNGQRVSSPVSVKIGDSIVASAVEYELIAVQSDG